MHRQTSWKPHQSILLYSFLLIILCAIVLLYLHSSLGGERVYLNSGIALKPKDLSKALIMLALIIAPFPATRYADEIFDIRTRRLAPFASLFVLLIFPLSFKFVLWQTATYANGEPIYDLKNQPAKTTYASVGYRPLWKLDFSTLSPFESRMQSEGMRQVSRENYIWGEYLTYGLNRMGQSEKRYECVLVRITHILGFYLRDKRGEELVYTPVSSLPGDQCQIVGQP